VSLLGQCAGISENRNARVIFGVCSGCRGFSLLRQQSNTDFSAKYQANRRRARAVELCLVAELGWIQLVLGGVIAPGSIDHYAAHGSQRLIGLGPGVCFLSQLSVAWAVHFRPARLLHRIAGADYQRASRSRSCRPDLFRGSYQFLKVPISISGKQLRRSNNSGTRGCKARPFAITGPVDPRLVRIHRFARAHSTF